VIVVGEVMFGIIVAVGLAGVTCEAQAWVRECAARRRRGRRAAWERRQRAKRGGCYMDPKEFRRQFGVRLHELEESDAAQTFIAVAEYGRRSARGEE
jgi:hypothetical protein